MSDYDPYSHDEDEQDTERALSSYSDLFAAISFCFLFLYVVASLQGNVRHIQTTTEQLAIQDKKVAEVVAKYEKLLAAHRLDKDKYLASADDSEKKSYEEALKNLHHLASQEEARKNQLAQELGQAQEKSKALSDYQQLIKNIVESNLALKKKVADKEVELEKSKEIFVKRTEDKFKTQLEAQVLEAKTAAELAKAQQIQEVEKLYQEQVSAVQSEKARTQQEKDKLKEQVSQLARERQKAVQKLELEHAEQVARLQGDFESRESELQTEVKSVSALAKKAQRELAQARSKEEITTGIVASLQNEFKKNGISASIDPKTGEVSLNFLSVYFDLGQHKLKEQMELDLQKFMPSYAQAIYADPRNANAIDHIEVIGFASPTFDKKYIDPSELKVQNLDAVSFNLDLSYKRAKSIFKYIFNPQKLSYKHQNDIFKITKVSGRSFLEGTAANDGRTPASGELSREDYCAKFDCKKQQKVVIKFHLKP